jgi:hypothetical protein
MYPNQTRSHACAIVLRRPTALLFRSPMWWLSVYYATTIWRSLCRQWTCIESGALCVHRRWAYLPRLRNRMLNQHPIYLWYPNALFLPFRAFFSTARSLNQVHYVYTADELTCVFYGIEWMLNQHPIYLWYPNAPLPPAAIRACWSATFFSGLALNQVHYVYTADELTWYVYGIEC